MSSRFSNNLITKEVSARIRRLLERTERNIKDIQVAGDAFACPVLNEWHFAAIHAFRLLTLTLQKDQKSELDKALRSLENAYSDSCIILLSIYLENAHRIVSRYMGANLSQSYLTFLKEYKDTARTGVKFLRNWDQSIVDKKLTDDDVEKVEDILSRFHKAEGKLYAIEPELEYFKRRQRWRLLFGGMMTFLAALISFISLLFTISHWR